MCAPASQEMALNPNPTIQDLEKSLMSNASTDVTMDGDKYLKYRPNYEIKESVH